MALAKDINERNGSRAVSAASSSVDYGSDGARERFLNGVGNGNGNGGSASKPSVTSINLGTAGGEGGTGSRRTAASTVSATGQNVYETYAEGELYFRKTGQQSSTIQDLWKNDPNARSDFELYKEERAKQFDLINGKWQRANETGDQSVLAGLDQSITFQNWDITNNGFDGFDFVDVPTMYGSPYRLNRDAISWIQNRFAQDVENGTVGKGYDYYLDEDDQARKFNGQYSRTLTKVFNSNSANRNLSEMRLPPSQKLNDYLDDYISYIGNGVTQYTDDFTKYASDQMQRGWKYTTTVDDLSKQTEGGMPTAYAAKYKYSNGNFKTAQDEYNFNHGLPPADDMETVIGSYTQYQQQTQRVNEFYATLSRYAYDLDKEAAAGSSADKSNSDSLQQAYKGMLDLPAWSDVRAIVDAPDEPAKEYEYDYALSDADNYNAKIAHDRAIAEKVDKDDPYAVDVSFDGFTDFYGKHVGELFDQDVVDDAISSSNAESRSQAVDDVSGFGKIFAKGSVTAYLDEHPNMAYTDMFDIMFEANATRGQAKAARDYYIGKEQSALSEAIKTADPKEKDALKKKSAEAVAAITAKFDDFEFKSQSRNDHGPSNEQVAAGFEKAKASVGDAIDSVKQSFKDNSDTNREDALVKKIEDTAGIGLSKMRDDDVLSFIDGALLFDDSGALDADSAVKAIEQLSTSGISAEQLDGIVLNALSSPMSSMDEPERMSVQRALSAATRDIAKSNVDRRIALLNGKRGELGMTDLQYYNMLNRNGLGDGIDQEAFARAHYVEVDFPKLMEEDRNARVALDWDRLTNAERIAIGNESWDNGTSADARAGYVSGFVEGKPYNPAIHKTKVEQYSDQFGLFFTNILNRAGANIASSVIGFADMATTGAGGRNDRWQVTKDVAEYAARANAKGKSTEQDFGSTALSMSSDVATELVRMYALNAVGGAVSKGASVAFTKASTKVFGASATAKIGSNVILQKAAKFAVESPSIVIPAMGAAYNEAMENGATVEQATKFGVASGFVEGVIEKANIDSWVTGGSISARYAKNLSTGIAKYQGAGYARKAACIKLLSSFLGEAAEEGISYGVGVHLNRALDIDPNAQFIATEFLEQSFMGGLVGMTGAGLSMGGKYSSTNMLFDYMAQNKISADVKDLYTASFAVESMSADRFAQGSLNAQALSLDDHTSVQRDLDAHTRQMQSDRAKYDSDIGKINAELQAKIDAVTAIKSRVAALDPNDAAGAAEIGKLAEHLRVAESELDVERKQATDKLTVLQSSFTETQAQHRAALEKAQAKMDSHNIALYNIMQPEIARMRGVTLAQQQRAAANAQLKQRYQQFDTAYRSESFYAGMFDEMDAASADAAVQYGNLDSADAALAEAADLDAAIKAKMMNVRAGTYEQFERARQAEADAVAATAAEKMAQPKQFTQENGSIKAGRVTVIKNPYTGAVPSNVESQSSAPVEVNPTSVNDARSRIQQAELQASEGISGYTAFIKDAYEKLFGNKYSGIDVQAKGVVFNGAPYVVRVYKNVIGKITSDANLSAEKLALLECIPQMIEVGEYVGSSIPSAGNPKKERIVRYDHFEAPVLIPNDDGFDEYVAAFDVEAYSYQNKFKTYRLGEINLTPASVQYGSNQAAASTRPPESNASSSDMSIRDSSPEMQVENSGAQGNIRSQLPANASIENSVGARKANPGGWTESRVSSNTYNAVFDPAERAMYEIDGDEFNYQRQSEQQSLDRARDSLMEAEQSGSIDALYDRLMNPSLAWDATDNDTAMGLASKFRQDGDLLRMRELLHAVQAHGSQGGQLVQSFAKYSRTPDGQLLEAEKNIANAEKNANPKQKQQMDASVQGIMDAVDAALAEGADASTLRSAVEKATNKKVADNLNNALQRFVNSDITRKQLDDFIINTARDSVGLPSFTLDQAQEFIHLVNQAEAETDEHTKKTYYAQAAQLIADTEPVGRGEKIKAVRRIAMLLNPKTGVKNFMANAPMAVLETAKDIIGTPIDKLASKVTGERTTTAFTSARYAAQAKGFARGMTDAVKDIKTGVQTSELPGRYDLDARGRVFESNFMNNLNNAVGLWMQLGDRAWARSAYESRVAELGALGRDVNSKEVADDAALYALDRVFQNNSDLAKRASTARKAMGEFGDLLIPFVQTPANIADKLIDYSPAGLVRIASQLGKSAKTGEFDQKLFVDRCSRCITGTGIIALGAAMLAKGLISGAGDDKEEKEAIKNAGAGEYAIKIGDRYNTIDWAEPAGSLLIIGAGLYKLLGKNGIASEMAQLDGWRKADTLIEAGAAGINAFANNSFLSSLANAIAYNDTVGDVIVDTIMNSASQYTPSGLSALARTADNYERDTYDPSMLRSQAKYLISRIPGLRNLLPVKIGTDGELVRNRAGDGVLERVVQTMLIPNYATQETNDAVNAEIYRLYVAGFTDQILPDSEKKINGYKLTAQERREYQSDLGAATHSAALAAMRSSHYARATDDDKAFILSEAIDDAKRGVTKKWRAMIKEEYEKKYAD